MSEPNEPRISFDGIDREFYAQARVKLGEDPAVGELFVQLARQYGSGKIIRDLCDEICLLIDERDTARTQLGELASRSGDVG